MQRRDFLGFVGAAAAATAVVSSGACADDEDRLPRRGAGSGDWEPVRRLFVADRDWIHMAGMLLATHPRELGSSIERRRRALDENPAMHVEARNRELEAASRSAAAAYLGVRPGDVALTESTTMGIALVYNGVAIRPDQEFLTTTHDYYSTLESLRFRAQRTGAGTRTIEPFASSARTSADEIAGRITAAITPATRMLALTWVHSWTGVKVPVRQIADRVAVVNAGRAPADRVLIGLDGVHGLGVEDVDLPDLGCDFFMAGAHKWLFGPRGTGVLWGSPGAQDAVTPTIPTFSAETGWGGRMTPGGFKAFEHVWSLADAFELHDDIGRDRIASRIRDLATQCKQGLARMPHVRLHTPLDPTISAGIISFDVDGLSADAVVGRLEDRRIIASVTPYDVPHARLSPGLLNDPGEVDAVLAAIHDLG